MNTEVMAKGAEATGIKLQRLQERLDAGTLSFDQFKALATSVLTRAKAQGYSLGDLGAAADLTKLRRSLVIPLGLSAPEETESTAAALVQLTAASEPYRADAMAAIAVLGSSFFLEGVQEATGRALESHGARYWVRVLNAGACDLCEVLAEDTLPASATMYHHKGCGCSQQPVDEKE